MLRLASQRFAACSRNQKHISRLPQTAAATLHRRQFHQSQPEGDLLSEEPSSQQKVTTLDNGVRVASDGHPGFSIGVGAYVNSGSRYEYGVTHGFSHMIDRLAFRASAKRTHEQTTEAIDDLGGMFMAGGARECMVYQGVTYNDKLETAVDILADTVTQPVIEDADINDIREPIMFELMSIEAKPELLLPEILHEVAYNGNTLGNPLLCPPETAANATAAQIRSALDSWYIPERIVVAGAGVNHDELVEYAQKYFGHLKARKPDITLPGLSGYAGKLTPSMDPLTVPSPEVYQTLATWHPEETNAILPADWVVGPPETATLEKIATAPSVYTGGIRLEEDLSLPYTQIYVAFEAFPFLDADTYTQAVLQTLLGGGGSFSAGGPGKGIYSRIYTGVLNNYRDVDACSAFVNSYTDSGLFGIHMACEPRFVPMGLNIIAEQLYNCSLSPAVGGPTEAQLSRAKNQLKSMITMNMESRNVQIEDLGRQVLARGHKVPVEKMCEEIDKVTLTDISRATRRILAPHTSDLPHDKIKPGTPSILIKGCLDYVPSSKKLLRGFTF